MWPDNWQSVGVFSAMSTQWRVGSGGPYGLDYGAIPDVLRLMAVPRGEWPGVFSDLRVMEDAALTELRKR